MAGSFTAGGLITGLDTNNIIRQLLEIERQPIIRIQQRINRLETQQTAIRDLRTTLLTLRNRIQDFRNDTVFNQFGATSSSETVLRAAVSGENPIVGAFLINVTQLATATVATSSGALGAAINPGATLNSSGISTTVQSGTFTINGVTFNVDPAAQSLNDILTAINASGAGVTATYNAGTDKVTIANSSPGNTSIINFGASGDTSNLLTAINVVGATQSTGLGGSTEVTSTRNLGAVNPNAVLNTVTFGAGAVSAGSFFVNGISISVDPTVDSLQDVIERINSSDAAVTSSYDGTTDTIRVVSDTLGSRTISFTAGTSNFLTSTKLVSAIQTAGNDAQFTVNGGPVQTRNTNEITDAIGGVTLTLLSTGSSTVTIGADNDAIEEDVRAFIDAFNTSLTSLRNLLGSEGALRGDGTIRTVESFLRSTIFKQVTGIGGSFASLVDVGITTGDVFDSSQVPQLHLDEEEFLDALRSNATNVADLFSNSANSGIADLLFDFVDQTTTSTGSLNNRSRAGGSIDDQIQGFNDQIERIQERLEQRERRLRAQFAQLEQISSGFQAQNASLAALSANLLNLR